jgi:hypothetical protein
MTYSDEPLQQVRRAVPVAPPLPALSPRAIHPDVNDKD